MEPLRVPGHPELLLGALTCGGVRIIDDAPLRALRLPRTVADRVIAAAERELARRDALYHAERPPAVVRERRVIVVDEGCASSLPMRAALVWAREQRPSRLAAATPVTTVAACLEMGALADEVLCAVTVNKLQSLASWYAQLPPVSDLQASVLAERARLGHGAPEG